MHAQNWLSSSELKAIEKRLRSQPKEQEKQEGAKQVKGHVDNMTMIIEDLHEAIVKYQVRPRLYTVSNVHSRGRWSNRI